MKTHLLFALLPLGVLSKACEITPDAGPDAAVPDAGVPDVFPPVHAPLPPINPCDPVWQRAGYHPTTTPAVPGSVAEFEQKLDTWSALWVGNNTFLMPDYRAKVEIDEFTAAVSGGGGKNGSRPILKEANAWYLADIPIAVYTVKASEVAMYSGGETQAQVFGYCFSDNSFRTSSTVPPSCNALSVTHVVIKYDPKCVCNASEVVGVISATDS